MNINTQICKKLTSGPKIARYFFDHTWLKDYLNRSTIVRQLICVFLTCSVNLCSDTRVAAATRGRRYLRAVRPARSSSLARTAALNAAASVIHGTCLPPMMLNGSSPFASRYTSAGRGSS